MRSAMHTTLQLLLVSLTAALRCSAPAVRVETVRNQSPQTTAHRTPRMTVALTAGGC